MNDTSAPLLGRIALRFDADSAHVPADLSAATRTKAGTLLLVGDELASLEVLVPHKGRPQLYGEHQSCALHAALGIDEGQEVDLEGLTYVEDESALFLVGSHSATRKKPRGKSEDKGLTRLTVVEEDASRELLARIPLRDGKPALDKKGVALLPSGDEQGLLALLGDDPHLGAFVQRRGGSRLPGKDNGFDIEGLTYFDGRLLLGLRGPVLRGWAFVIDLEVEARGAELSIGGKKKQRYRKHALDLGGLGVRELFVRGDDVFILAGPTMALDGSHRLFRWIGGPSGKQDGLIGQEASVLEPLFDLPYTRGFDRAEGVCNWSWFDEDDALLVVYDTPSEARRLDARTVIADVFANPS